MPDSETLSISASDFPTPPPINMGDLPPRTFCCIPVRFLVLSMSILGCTGGSVMAGLGWDSAVHKGEWRFILLYHVLIICRGNISD
jgi:hypothetical protein